jgi:uncharacterized membrane protein YedE/YeeE
MGFSGIVRQPYPGRIVLIVTAPVAGHKCRLGEPVWPSKMAVFKILAGYPFGLGIVAVEGCHGRIEAQDEKQYD